MAEPKILIGTVTCDKYGYCLDEFLGAVKDLSYENYEVCIVDNSKDDAYAERLRGKGLNVKRLPHKEEVREMLIEGHNFLKEKALQDGFDYLFILDQDVIVPFNVIKRLTGHGKKIVTGLYYNIFNVRYNTQMGSEEKENELMPVLYKEGSDENKVVQFTVDEVREPKFLEIRQCGTGCLLVAREVLEKVGFRHVTGSKNFDDTWFCSDVRKKGYKIYCDTSMKCTHRIFDKKIAKDVWDNKD
ncbi:MAG: glycosyltransferase [Candidatus Woesearchaeota archaeon]|jgi:GT2 family glycosyltransferase|nr:glycosyltransferase [Candidatus Woesearchaeota archaeon]MDP7324137.1 glycosyltransferase [Candidatus Woesearchaeota archaeon]MDP7458217.1 glycosyltransferase [Candidatus Woesearchaeota archaeon]